MKKLQCKKCGNFVGRDEVDFNVEGSEIGKLPDGTSVLEIAIHRDCGSKIIEIEES